jgi:penicillin-binding protein 1C
VSEVSEKAPHPTLSPKGRGLKIAALILPVLVLVGLYVATFPPLLPSYSRVLGGWHPSESWLYDRNGRLVDSVRVDFSARRLAWVSLKDISPALVETVIASEDKRFREHGGVDWLAIANAAKARFDGVSSRGASTISMQVAAFLSPGLAAPGARTWRDKMRQMRAASALESSWSKDQILEAYFNLAGYRGEAQGIGAAALALFGKAPGALSKRDAVLVAALLPDPGAGIGEVGERACHIERAVRVSTTLDTRGEEEGQCALLKAAAADMLSSERARALDPGMAPHLANRLLVKPGIKVTTTLDFDIQRAATAALTRQLQGLGAARARGMARWW